MYNRYICNFAKAKTLELDIDELIDEKKFNSQSLAFQDLVLRAWIGEDLLLYCLDDTNESTEIVRAITEVVAKCAVVLCAEPVQVTRSGGYSFQGTNSLAMTEKDRKRLLSTARLEALTTCRQIVNIAKQQGIASTPEEYLEVNLFSLFTLKLI